MRAFQENLLVLLASALILFAPLIRSGKTTIALMTMELLGIALLTIIFWGGLLKGRVEKSIAWFLIGSLGAALLYLIPLPISVWSQLPGRAFYAEHLSWLSPEFQSSAYLDVSMIPYRSISGLLALLAPLGIFLTVLALPARKVTWLVYMLLLAALGQAGLSIAQYFIQDQALFFRMWSNGVPLGTYVNQNHLVAFLEMVEPLAIALMIAVLIKQDSHFVTKIILATLFGIISLALTVTPLLTTSRMGATLLVVSVLLSFWVMTTPEIRKTVAKPIIALRFVLLILAVAIQIKVFQQAVTTTYADRLSPQGIIGDMRWDIYTGTAQAIQDTLPIGSGPGTTPQIYQLYQPTQINAFVNHTHNDYLELLLDMGVAGLIIILSFLFIYIRRWKSLNKENYTQFKLLQSGAGVGVLLALLYSITDFGLHTPANAIFFAFLVGLFLHSSLSHPTLSSRLKP